MNRSQSTLVAVGFGVTLLGLTARAQFAPPDRVIWPPHPFPVPRPRPMLNQELQLVSQSARVEIDGGVAKTKLEQTFENTTDRTIEGTYVFPLPEGAAISGFAMNVNGKRVEAEILDGDKAREIYTGIVQKMRDPAILEFIDRNLVRARIFPIPARSQPKIELEYSEALKPETAGKEGGSFRYVLPLRLPVGGTARAASVDIQLRSPQGLRAIYSPTHGIDVKRNGQSARVTGEFSGDAKPIQSTLDSGAPAARGGSDRDFVLYFTTAKARVGVDLITHRAAGDDGYFMLLVAPDTQIAAKEIAAKDVVFVFDTSGSMAGEKIEQARRALLTLLNNLNPNDRFNIVTFSSDTRAFRDGLVAVNKDTLDAARAWVGEIKAVGGTNINDALIDGFKILKSAPGFGRPQQMVFMTDGQPTVGETDIVQILKNARTSNSSVVKNDTPQFEVARLFAFGVGFDVNTRLLDTLAEDNRGSSDYVLPQEDIEQKVGSLYQKIAFPVLSNPRLDWGGTRVYDVYPKRLPDLFKGTQAVVFGRYAGENVGQARVQLVGRAMGREETINGIGDWRHEGRQNDTLPRLWAMRKVGYLVDDARLSGRPVANEVRDEIIKLSKKYGIVTPFTAGLITEDERPQLGAPVPAGGGNGSVVRHRFESGGRFGSGGGFGGGATSSAGAPSRDLQLAAPAAGQTAVIAARASKDMKESERIDGDAQSTRYIEGKAFFRRGEVWTDGAYDAAKSPKPQVVKFGSAAYFALVKDAKIAKWLSLGESVLIVLPDRVVQIEP